LSNGHSEALDGLHNNWPKARLVENPIITQPLVARIFHSVSRSTDSPIHLFLSGSNFQLKVWEALLQVPSGNVVSYRDVASYLGTPKASRAVGNALANNPVAVLIPCHRVINALGEFGHYHYGDARKVALLGWEMAKVAYPGS
jgi:AraC family transcriptional regulator of adaptative response/methylated-DNA-[protein]-cysteine methyltransferase